MAKRARGGRGEASGSRLKAELMDGSDLRLPAARLDLGRPGDAVGRLIELALEEDVGPGDRTAEACVSADAHGTAMIVAKEPLVVSGVSAAARVFRSLDAECEVEVLLGEGAAADAGAGVLRVRGKLRAILTGER